ncbi:unnamed protein product [Fusarium venenatum]|uniref:Uncharacterized protein n=1 Tax=Fusarium venenatum TaxID=56646 RepID=A0A2L2T6K4_9HYPO|nr:uncharacterized protein FVRRES_12279 [Fusarium venenatum]CEI39588.1 unnamed protein product [Fusarium venenatum]
MDITGSGSTKAGSAAREEQTMLNRISKVEDLSSDQGALRLVLAITTSVYRRQIGSDRLDLARSDAAQIRSRDFDQAGHLKLGGQGQKPESGLMVWLSNVDSYFVQ